MEFNREFLVINNIKLPINASFEEALSVAKKKIKSLRLASLATDFSIYKRSIDARNKDDIKFVYSVAITGDFSNVNVEFLKSNGVSVTQSLRMSELKMGDEVLNNPPVIVGSGPCGLFSALILAENGYKPILLERGGSVAERQSVINEFYDTHVLPLDTNIQFGAGGAGTFSDGKLVTRVNDPLTHYILRRFVEFGAPEEILFIAKPHIGTDVLSRVVENIISRIKELGGKVFYHTKFISPNVKNNEVVSINTNVGVLECGALILAIGHSARDTYETLIKSNFSIEAKDFSVGMRIEHLASEIDEAMFGKYAGNKALGHAEYALSTNTKERGTYTFCMCPGGVVVAAASEESGVVVNGMSYNSRSEINSNSAVVTSVFREDYGSTPLRAIEFQREIERKAFVAGGRGYSAPIITVGDFLEGKCITEPTRVIPSYMNGNNVKLSSPSNYLPDFVTRGIKQGILDFDKKINGFASKYAVLTGAETRTSAPVRILRDNISRLAIGYKNIFPSGEGAGYAGGITSAAIDGAKTAFTLIERYKSFYI